MLVEWTMPNVYSIWSQNGSKPDLRLLPGINEVEEKLWEKCAKHPNVQLNIDEGNLVVRSEKPDPSRKKPTEGLMGYEVREAKLIVKETFDKELLAKWDTIDDRSAIRTEIKNQIEKVDKSVRLKTDDEKNQ